MTDRYRMEYVNCEVSVIIDDLENQELTAEELTDRLNHETRMHKKWKKDYYSMRDAIKEAAKNERTNMGQSVLRQLADNLGINLEE